MKTGALGIDISRWNVLNDARQVKDYGIEFAIIREGHGINTDISFFSHVEKLKKAGIMIAGVYHFSYALNEQSAVEEAKICINNLKMAGIKPSDNFTVFYDFEYDTVDQVAKAGVTLTRKECNLFTKAFCETIRSAGYNAGVYFNYDYYKNWYDKSVLDSYTKWYARWNGDVLDGVLFHQYYNKGSIPGLVGDVDMNRYLGADIEEPLKSAIGSWPNLEEAFSGVAKILSALGYSDDDLHKLM